MGCAQWYGLQPCLPENKFSATMPTTHTALRADKTEQKVELRSSKNASLNKKPSGLIARTQLIMCCKTINNNFRNLSYSYNKYNKWHEKILKDSYHRVMTLSLTT